MLSALNAYGHSWVNMKKGGILTIKRKSQDVSTELVTPSGENKVSFAYRSHDRCYLSYVRTPNALCQLHFITCRSRSVDSYQRSAVVAPELVAAGLQQR